MKRKAGGVQSDPQPLFRAPQQPPRLGGQPPELVPPLLRGLQTLQLVADLLGERRAAAEVADPLAALVPKAKFENDPPIPTVLGRDEPLPGECGKLLAIEW